MTPAISVKDISKLYKLGKINRHTLSDELIYSWRRMTGRNPDVLSKVDKKVRTTDFWALKHVSFDIEPGDSVALIGRNGAGKSTMLKILSRITVPTSGEAVINGRVGTMLEVGTGFHPEFTGRENIFVNGAILGMNRREIESKFDEIVDFAEVGPFIDTPVKRYSSGMYVRLAFSVAAHLRPEILLLDEVLAVGDAPFKEKCLTKMNAMTAELGTTVVFVSHNMNFVKQLCKTAIWLQGGEIFKMGPTEKIAEEYRLQYGAVAENGKRKG